jgi:hypothetical protein
VARSKIRRRSLSANDGTVGGANALRQPAWRALIALFVVSRIWLFWFCQPQFSDVYVYYQYAVQTIDLHARPYVDVPIEYPPLSYYLMALPGWARSGRVTVDLIAQRSPALDELYASYTQLFRGEMLLFDLAALWLWWLIVRRREPTEAWWATAAFIAVPVVLADVAYDRLDLPFLFLLLAAYYCRQRADDAPTTDQSPPYWLALSYGLVGLGIAYRVIPVLVVPVLVVFEGRQSLHTRRWQPLWWGLAAVTGGVLVPTLPAFLSAGTAVFGFLRYHRERGIEIESTWASIQMVLAGCGAPIEVYGGHGGQNVRGLYSDALLLLSTLGVLFVVGAVTMAILLRRTPLTGSQLSRLTLIVMLLAAVGSKVLSVQYFIWALPLMLLIAVETPTLARHLAYVAPCVLVIAGLSSLVFPHFFFADTTIWGREWKHGWSLLDLHWFPVWVLGMRNLLFVAGVSWLAWGLYREVKQATPTAG